MSTVLVVDDEADLRLLYRLVLRHHGHDVVESASAEQGLAILETTCPDFMVLDIRMPGMGGWAMLARIRATSRLAQLKVIVCSAHAGPADRHRAETEGAAAFLSKPFQPTDLIRLLDEWCDQSAPTIES